MDQEYIRRKIVRLSKELADETDYAQIRRLRKIIAALKAIYKSSDPKNLGELISGK